VGANYDFSKPSATWALLFYFPTAQIKPAFPPAPKQSKFFDRIISAGNAHLTLKKTQNHHRELWWHVGCLSREGMIIDYIYSCSQEFDDSCFFQRLTLIDICCGPPVAG